MSAFKSVVDLDQQNGGTQQNPSSRSNKEQGMDKSIKRRTGVEIHIIAVGVEER